MPYYFIYIYDTLHNVEYVFWGLHNFECLCYMCHQRIYLCSIYIPWRLQLLEPLKSGMCGCNMTSNMIINRWKVESFCFSPPRIVVMLVLLELTMKLDAVLRSVVSHRVDVPSWYQKCGQHTICSICFLKGFEIETMQSANSIWVHVQLVVGHLFRNTDLDDRICFGINFHIVPSVVNVKVGAHTNIIRSLPVLMV